MLISLLYRSFPTIIVGINVSMVDREIKKHKIGDKWLWIRNRSRRQSIPQYLIYIYNTIT